MCTRYPIINRVSELKVHIELTHFVQPGKIEIDANERTVNENLKTVFSFAPYSILSLTICISVCFKNGQSRLELPAHCTNYAIFSCLHLILH